MTARACGGQASFVHEHLHRRGGQTGARLFCALGLFLILAACSGDARGGQAPVIAAAGDIACDTDPEPQADCRHKATSNLLIGGDYEAVLPLGDIQYDNGSRRNFKSSYDPTWGRLKRITHPVPGNHDYRTKRARGYFDYFGSAAGRAKKGYYSYEIAGWHLIALNSEIPHGPASEQLSWLRRDLASSRAKCTLAYWHRPRFSSGEHGSDESMGPFWQELYDAAADVVLSGHDHDYERFSPQDPNGDADHERGIRSFVVGTGGESLRPFGETQPNSEVRNASTYGVLTLTLHASGYEWEFVPAGPAEFRDSGHGDCH